MVELVRKKSVDQGWVVRHSQPLKAAFRMLFGLIWLIDGSFKFAPGLITKFPGLVTTAGQGQPAWLHPWFSFWAAQATAQPALWVYGTGALELTVATCLVLGLLRKLAYLGGILLSLLIWAVPEGFGGPYGPGSTDIGTGIVYALVFVALVVFNAGYGPSRWSLDYYIEQRWPRWAVLSEFQKLVPREEPSSLPVTGGSHGAE